MNTRWNMVCFLFLGILSISFLLFSLIIAERNAGKRNLAALGAALCALGAFTVVVMGLNEPARILHILSSPRKGFSSAVIMQIAVFITALIVFFRLRERNFIIITGAGIISLMAAAGLARLYMISTRPALNTVLFIFLFILLTVLAAMMFVSSRSDTDRVKYFPVLLAVVGLYGLGAVAFMVRLSLLNPPDRILTFDKLVWGGMAPVFWMAVGGTGIMPVIYLFLGRRTGKFPLPAVFCGLYVIGVMGISILVNQMPVVARGINGRIFF